MVALSLRDLPPASGVAAAQFLQAPPRAVFAATAAAPVRLVVLDGAEAAQETGPGCFMTWPGQPRRPDWAWWP